SYLRVGSAPQLMRARRSVWAKWIHAQGWPVAPELSTSILIEGDAIEPQTPDPAALPRPKSKKRHRGGAPNTVEKEVGEWWSTLKPDEKKLSNSSLANSYKA